MECVTAIATGIVSKIGEMLVEPIGAQLGNLICYDNNINNVKGAHKALEDRKQEVQRLVDADKRNGREVVPNVERWFGEVADIENVFQRFCEDEVNRNKKCLGGWCPNLNTRYSLSKRAKKTMAKLVFLKEEKLETISCPAPPPKLSSIFAKGIKSFESRKSIIKEVIEKLKDERFKRISICGMGGVGKTTLVKEVIKIVEADKLFDEVVMTMVSQTPDYWKIQGAIADRLDLKLDKETLQGRAYQLLHRINKIARVLIVLDDVWMELDFELIGIPSNEDEKACKVIFTSRNEGTCQKMGSQKTFTVNILSREESWGLFREITSGGDVVSNPDIHPIAKEIANECGGLPIAIVTVGKALLGNKKKYVWEDALNQLRKSSGSFSEVEKCIELSYNLLDREKAKYFLFLCCLFPEDADIPIEVLMREGWGLGLFKDQGALWEVRNQLHTLMNDLKTRYLLLDSDKAECVKMHDVVRDVVISIASTKEHDFKIQCDAEKKWQEESTWNSSSAVSIMMDEVKECLSVVEYPKLELLQMASKGRQPIPINFFQGMTMLKVLCLQSLCIPKVSTQFQALNNLRTLRLEDCEVGDISIIGNELLKLEILSFAYSNIKELPIEIGKLGFLRLLDLTGCNDLDKFSSKVLTSLSQLEELYFRVKNFPWRQNNVILIELEKISRRLKVIEIRVRKVELLPKDLVFENVERFWVYVVPYANFNRRGYMESNILQLTAVDYNSIKFSKTIKQLIKKCEILIIKKVKNLKNVICELEDGAGLPCLKDLEVNHCFNLEYLVDGGEVQQSMIDFSYLVNLKFEALPSLIGFSKAIDLNLPDQTMPHGSSVESTKVEDGQLLSRSHSESRGDKSIPLSGKLFSSNWMQKFPKLETILLQECTSLEMVFDMQGYSQSDGQLLAVLFPQLKEIKIYYLNKITHVWGNVPRCVQGFQYLRYLAISNCDSLRHIFTPAIVRAITELEKLEIESCKLMENLVVGSIDDEEEDNKGKEKVKTIVFNKLYSLSLSRLPRLVSICPNSYELEWPSLRQLDINDCPMLKISFLLTQMHAKGDNLVVPSYSNIHDTGFNSCKENYSRPFNWHLGCIPLPPKFIRQGGTNKSSKAVSIAQEHVPSSSEMKAKGEIGRMPILEDLYVRKCDLLDVLFPLEEKYNSTIPPYLKTIKIEQCDKLETIVAKREERTDVMNSFAQLESLDLQDLPNLARFCFSGACTSLDKQDDMGSCEGDQRKLRHDPLIDGFWFPNLTSLFIQNCNKVSILFSPSSSRSLKHLEKLEVRYCENIEEIVSQEEREASTNKIIFHGLQHLLLIGLPNLKAFCQGSYDFDFPSLRQVRIEGCPNMEVFSRGTSHTPKLEVLNVEIKPHSSNYIQMGDLNATIHGFKAFVALQTSEMLRWRELHDDSLFGYFNNESGMNVTRFHNLLSLVPLNEIHMLKHQRKLTIEGCDSLVEVFESEGGVDANKGDASVHVTHYELQHMNLYNLPKLRHIWKHNITGIVSFQKLTSIEIRGCHSLKSLLSHSMARSLVQLQKLQVHYCDMMEEIVTKEEGNTEGGSKVKILFPKLKTLGLYGLPRLECICSGDYDYDLPLCDEEDKEMNNNNNNKVEISFPELTEMYVDIVPKLKCFCSGAYDYDPILSTSCNEEIIEECPQIPTFPNATVSVTTPKLYHINILLFNYIRTLGDINLAIHYGQNSEKYKGELQKLETFRCIEQHQHLLLLGYITRVSWLELESCDKLLNCVPSNMIHRFQHLQSLLVQQCGCLQEIFESEGVGGANENDYEGDTRIQYELYYMELHSLPKLMHIWKIHGRVLGFQNLKRLTISGCHNLKYVFPLSIARSLPTLIELSVCDCKKMEEIIVTREWEEQIHNIFVEREAKIIFRYLSEIKLEELPSLSCFCPSSCSCYLELPGCWNISIEECPKMETFCYGTLYTPGLIYLSVEKTKFDKDEDVNEVIQQVRHREQ